MLIVWIMGAMVIAITETYILNDLWANLYKDYF